MPEPGGAVDQDRLRKDDSKAGKYSGKTREQREKSMIEQAMRACPLWCGRGETVSVLLVFKTEQSEFLLPRLLNPSPAKPRARV